jgi:pimeloyl-ACP methyl ester carboxylesterase
MTTFVLVHGGFGDSWYWNGTAAALEREGHRVLRVELTTSGPDPAALGDFAADVAETRRVLDSADEPVVLVGHSSGGMAVTEVADHPGIAHSVYVSAAWPERGQSFGEVFRNADLGWVVPTADGAALSVTPDVETAHRDLCADAPMEIAAAWHARLGYQAVGDVGTPSSAPDRTHPVTYVVLEQDRCLPPADQEATATRADRVERLATSHNPQISDPEGLAAVLARVPVPADAP